MCYSQIQYKQVEIVENRDVFAALTKRKFLLVLSQLFYVFKLEHCIKLRQRMKKDAV